MIDEQMVLLRNRIETAVKLIASLKSENEALKRDLSKTLSDKNCLQSEIDRLKYTIPAESSFQMTAADTIGSVDKESSGLRGSSFDKITSPIYPQEFNTTLTDSFESLSNEHKTTSDISNPSRFFSEESAGISNVDDDPFFDTWMQLESSSLKKKDPLTEDISSANPFEEKYRTASPSVEMKHSDNQSDSPAYSQLDIFY